MGPVRIGTGRMAFGRIDTSKNWIGRMWTRTNRNRKKGISYRGQDEWEPVRMWSCEWIPEERGLEYG